MKRQRLSVIIIAGLLLGLGIPAFLMLVWDLQLQRQRLEEQLQQRSMLVLQVLQLSLTEPLWNLNDLGAGKLAEAMAQDPAIHSIVVSNAEKEVFVQKSKTEAPPRPDEQLFTRAGSIEHLDRTIGYVTIEFSRLPLEEELAQYSQNVTIHLAVQLALGLGFLGWLLQKRVLRPLGRLVEQAHALEQRDFGFEGRLENKDELGRLSRVLDKARLQLAQLFQTVEQKNAELQTMNMHLEEKVLERTATIALILDNVQSGFLLIDAKLAIQAGFTRSCHWLFGETIEAGMSFRDVIYEGVDNRRDGDTLILSIRQIFDDLVPENVGLEQIPKRFGLRGKVLSLEGRILRHKSSGAVEYLLLTVLDVTELQIAEIENQRVRAILGILRQRDAFMSFIRETNQEMEQAHEGIRRGDQSLVRTNLHTIKGNAHAFGMTELSRLIHLVEDSDTIDGSQVDRIEAQFRDFMNRHSHVLNLSSDGTTEPSFRVMERDLLEMMRYLSSCEISESVRHHIHSWLLHLQAKPAIDLLGPLPEYAQALAEKRGKFVEVKIEQSEVPLLPQVCQPITQVLVHAIRNSIDHGIENTGERGDKPQVGLILIRFAETDRSWVISLIDDGRGIDVAALRDRLSETGLCSAEQAAQLTVDEIYDFLYQGRVSTAAELTETSGRGVGVKALYNAVQSVRGHMHFINRPGEGLQIDIEIPFPQGWLNRPTAKAA